MSNKQMRNADNRVLIYDAAQRLFNAYNRPFNRGQIVQETGLPVNIVREHLDALIEDGLLVRIERGVYGVNRVLQTRAISITLLPDGDTKIEVGDDILTLNPTEVKLLGSRLWHPSHEAMGVDPTVQAAAARTEQLVRSMQVAIANLHRASGGVQGDLLSSGDSLG